MAASPRWAMFTAMSAIVRPAAIKPRRPRRVAIVDRGVGHVGHEVHDRLADLGCGLGNSPDEVGAGGDDRVEDRAQRLAQLA